MFIDFETGCWVNGKTWRDEGIASIDPTKVESVSDCKVKVPEDTCIIRMVSGECFAVKRPRWIVRQEIARVAVHDIIG